MDGEGSVVVFDRSTTSLHCLAIVTEREPRFAKAVADWLDSGELPYLLLGSTGGPTPTQFALCARSTTHLLSDVLEEAATLLAVDVCPGCLATAVDEGLNELVGAVWSEILSLEPTPRTGRAMPSRSGAYTRTMGLSTRT